MTEYEVKPVEHPKPEPEPQQQQPETHVTVEQPDHSRVDVEQKPANDQPTDK